jgi:hypothetical protein
MDMTHSDGYSRFGVFILRWLQPFRCLHIQMVTAVSVSSSSLTAVLIFYRNILLISHHFTCVQWHKYGLRRYRGDKRGGGRILGCPKTYRILKFLLWALSDWITSFLQTAVFWISVMRSGSISLTVSGLPLVANL